ncbi:MAG: DUF4846 domain-containing protein [Ruminococcus sp.]|nr:DUF4846 domain-containing protein [Ruminococcus sp.]
MSIIKKAIIVMAVLLIMAALTAVYIRVNPKWEPAKLTIETSKRNTVQQCTDPDGMTVETRFVPPEGYGRVSAEQGSFGEYLRNYPLYPDGTVLPIFNGLTDDSPYTAAVFDISVGDEGYQQCADSIIRLYSDYFYENGQYDKIAFQFSNGFECSYDKWRKGKRVLAFGDYAFEVPAAGSDDSEQQYRNYLKEVMRYAGTISLQKESQVIPVDEMRIGDFICNDTHVVMIIDEAVNEKGENCYLIGQCFIPAACFHVVNNVDGENITPWFTQEELKKDSFKVCGFPFSRDKDIRRWKNGF